MECKFWHNDKNKRLLIFFAGWGSDENLFPPPAAVGYDYMLCYNFGNPDSDFSIIEKYEGIVLIAWSLGVWAAEKIFAGADMGHAVNWVRKIAVNGTPSPKNDIFGIPVNIFDGTLKNFSPASLLKFRKRMCGSVRELELFNANLPARDEKSLYEELASIDNLIGNAPQGFIPDFWDMAVVGEKDYIFPAANQVKYWQKCNVECVILENTAHYDSNLFLKLIKGGMLWKNH